MPHPYHALLWGMGASLACFLVAYMLRYRTTAHRVLALMGVTLNLVSSAYLIYAVRIQGIDMPANYGLPVVAAHRIFATAMAVLMILMLITGLRRVRTMHIRLHRFFLPGYALTYFSGLVIFHG